MNALQGGNRFVLAADLTPVQVSTRFFNATRGPFAKYQPSVAPHKGGLGCHICELQVIPNCTCLRGWAGGLDSCVVVETVLATQQTLSALNTPTKVLRAQVTSKWH